MDGTQTQTSLMSSMCVLGIYVVGFSADVLFMIRHDPLHILRLSADANAKACALEWNPQVDGTFAAATSDGMLSCYSFDIEVSMNYIVVRYDGNNVTCIGWSPKGKQLVVGDSSGYIKQYKPELTLVRTVPPPTSMILREDDATADAQQCVGISWLATTDFLVAYGPQSGRSRSMNVALLCVKKGASPRWTSFEDTCFCSGKSNFDEKVNFTQLLDWNLVLCSSYRSSEIVVLGKIGVDWKVWYLDDSGRIEMPLDGAHCESFPLGVCIDTSSTFPVKLGKISYKFLVGYIFRRIGCFFLKSYISAISVCHSFLNTFNP
ncbi:unnamed protein product [Gongylonema pulchrum]|uniref:ANAPC4_WD40 domain-containing protein n=1 Tax=Gongylonema pulchrum TaxID=637853 RepID=A0A183CX93_9BILA|nr:unnamed protein product [Gongylonema pulchrum]